MGKIGHLTALQGKYNFRAKFYPTESGGLKLAEEMACSNYIFNPDGLEPREQIERATGKTPVEEIAERSRARAKSKLYDIIMSNNFKWFVTLTLNPKEIDRSDYSAIVKKLNHFLGNRVRRQNLKYVGVAELHKKGGLHFHFLVNDALNLEHSGTYIRPSGGMPVKQSTLEKQGFTVEQCRDVYNVTDWKIGFSTAIELYGERAAIANYVGKYITKATQKVGGRWYYSGGELAKPVFSYARIDFDTFDPDFGFTCPLGEILVRRDFEKIPS